MPHPIGEVALLYFLFFTQHFQLLSQFSNFTYCYSLYCFRHVWPQSVAWAMKPPFNRRRSRARGLLFYRLTEQALATAPVRCPQLGGGVQPQWIVGEQCK